MWCSLFFSINTSNARSLNQALRALLWLRRSSPCAGEEAQAGRSVITSSP